MMIITSAEETLHAKEAYKRLSVTHGTRVCAYRADNGRFLYPPFKEAIRSCGQKIRFCGMESRHQNAIVDIRIKELTLGSQTLLLHATILWPEAVSTMLWPFSFKAYFHRYKSLEIDE